MATLVLILFSTNLIISIIPGKTSFETSEKETILLDRRIQVSLKSELADDDDKLGNRSSLDRYTVNKHSVGCTCHSMKLITQKAMNTNDYLDINHQLVTFQAKEEIPSNIFTFT